MWTPRILHANPGPGVVPCGGTASPRIAVRASVGPHEVHLRGHKDPRHGRRQVRRRQPLRFRPSP